MQRHRFQSFRVLVLLLGLLLSAGSVFAASAPRISTDELNSRLGEPDVVILDSRAHGDYGRAEVKITGAERADPRNIKSWAGNYDKEQTIIVYCAWSNEHTSARVVRKLIKLGFKDVYALKGGWGEWLQKGYPVEPK